MIKIAVTGGIGSGKSYISHLLENMHIPVYNADNEAKRLTVSDAGIRGELIALLGEEVYKDGLLNKPLLASYLFSNPAHVLQINSIIHPRVRKDFTVWVERQEKCEIVGMESAILYESRFDELVDEVWTVTAPEELRIGRVRQRSGLTEEEIKKRMAAQLSEEEKQRRAAHIIWNDGNVSVIHRVLSLLKSLE